jgi:hypothetical protein
MFSFVWLPIVLGFDSFVISFVLGPSVRGNKRYAVAAALGICDAAAVALSPVLESPILNALALLQGCALPALMIGYGLYMMALMRKATPSRLSSFGWVLLSIAASLDNLIAGSVVGGAVPLWVYAVVSTTMSLAGLVSSETLRQRLGAAARPFAIFSWVVGGALLAVVG